MHPITDIKINELLNKIFDNSPSLLTSIAPKGWSQSEYANFLHPTAKQQYEESIRLTERLNKWTQEKNEVEPLDNYKQDDLTNIPETEEFQYVLGLSVYDIFSNNHEVYNLEDNLIYDLGSFRGSGRFIADFINNKYSNKKYEYLDFYMGTIWIRDRANLLPFYEFIFKIIKMKTCDWNYSFPRLFLLDLSNEKSSDEENPELYSPEKSMNIELDMINKEKETLEFQKELDSSFEKEYDDAKYKPLVIIVQAYKNVYGKLPNDHPQKEFE